MEEYLTPPPGELDWPRAPFGEQAMHEGRVSDVTVDIAARLVQGRRASLLLPAQDDEKLRIAAATGISSQIVDRVSIRVGEPVAGVVARDRRPMLSNERKVNPGKGQRGYLTGSFISVPVSLGGGPCGVLSVADSRAPGGFRDDDVHALETLTEQIGPCLRLNQMSRQVDVLERSVLQLRRQVIEVQEAERQRIARDLHDEAGHALTAAILRLDLEMKQRQGDLAAINTLNRARNELVKCAKSLHDIAFNLRPRILEDFGLHAAIRSLARYTMGLSSLNISVEIAGEAWALNETDELAIVRVVQECMTNAQKYANASRLSVKLHYETEHVTLHVEDNGVGLKPRPINSGKEVDRKSLGINGMRERVELLGGMFWIGPGPEGGTLVSALLPR